MAGPEGRLSDELEAWLTGPAEKTLGSLADAFGEKSFPMLFALLLAVPALPLPTVGVSHVFEVIAVLLALELVLGRPEVWLPRRWRAVDLSGDRQTRLITGLVSLIRRLEGLSRPRLRALLHHRLTAFGFGLLVIAGAVGAFLAPPFSGLDTLPALGVVVLSLGVVLEDAAIAGAGALLEVAGIAVEIAAGAAAVHGVQSLI